MSAGLFDPAAALAGCGLEPTDKRVRVARALALLDRPATPQELLAALGGGMNRVTLYRILDLLVEHGLAARHHAGERAFRYCLRSAATGPAGGFGHAHFACSRCGATRCLDAKALEPGLSRLLGSLSMRVDSADISLGGVCEACLGA